MLGQSPAYQRVVAQLERAAPHDLPVVFLGETGTGKSQAAKRLWGGQGPFVEVGGLSDELAESELLGHEKGAFTGAHRLKLGHIEQANGGILFLDEVADLSPRLQFLFLRVVETGEYRRVGGETLLRSKFRVIAATCRDLAGMVADGTFREDLYHRLNVVTITMPPLRERGDDVIYLAESFLKREVTPAEADAFRAYDWPGNIRELGGVCDKLRAGWPIAEALQGDRVNLQAGQSDPRVNLQGRPEWVQVVCERARAHGLQKVADALGWKYETLRQRVSGKRGMTPAQVTELAAVVGMEIKVG